MFIKRTISIVLIFVLIMTGTTVAYGMELSTEAGETNGNIYEEESTPTDSGIIGTDSAITTDNAVDSNQPSTDSAVEVPQKTEQKITVMAAAKYFVKTMSSSGTMTQVGTSGYATVAEANTAMNSCYSGSKNKGLVVTDSNNKIINMISGIAYFKSSSATATIGNTYITPSDAMHFYGVSGANNANATVGISGAKASVAVSKLILVPETLVYPSTTTYYYRDYYTKNSSGDLVHFVYKISSPNTGSPYKSGTGKSKANGSFVVDKAPSWMSIGTKYYSADGITFYSDSAMTTKTGSSYYAYFKYLPYRSMSVYTTSELNKWISYKVGTSTSKIKSQGRNFINAQNRYGINSINELAFACLESAYGKSSLALNRNNLFGINAVDSNPSLAIPFSNARVCINKHAEYYLSRGYGDAKGDSRYYGLSPGNKSTGVGVKYASDPWHGEKISGIAYSIDKYLGSKEYRKFTVGVTNKNSVNVYKKAGSTVLYNLSNKSSGNGPAGIPVIILGSSGDYYMIQSDMPISGNSASYSYTYYYSNSTAYVKKSDLKVVNSGSRNYTTQIAKNRDLRNITVKVGTKNYLSGFDPGKTSYTVTVPKNTKTITINGTRLMTTSTVTGNGSKNLNKTTKTYKITVKSKSGSKKTYSIKVVPTGASTASTFKFGIYNSKTKLSNKSKKGKKTTAKNPMKIQTKVKTNSKRTTVKMVIYNKKKKVVAQKVQYIYKTKTVKFSWNGKYTYHNKLGKKAGKYAPRSKKGTKYYVRFIASRKGTKTHKGKYHTFYLYK